MKLPQIEIDRLNNYLARDYGYFNGLEQNWRIVWSDDQVEKRLVQHNEMGFELLYPIVAERPKYRQWIHQKYVLERLVAIPVGLETDMIGKTSYEPIWVYEDKDSNFLPPRYDVTCIVINNCLDNAARAIGKRYMDPRADKNYKDIKAQEVAELKELMFGNETSVGDSLSLGEGVGYTKPVKDVVN